MLKKGWFDDGTVSFKERKIHFSKYRCGEYHLLQASLT